MPGAEVKHTRLWAWSVAIFFGFVFVGSFIRGFRIQTLPRNNKWQTPSGQQLSEPAWLPSQPSSALQEEKKSGRRKRPHKRNEQHNSLGCGGTMKNPPTRWVGGM